MHNTHPPAHYRRIARRQAEREQAEVKQGLPIAAAKGKRQAAAREILAATKESDNAE